MPFRHMLTRAKRRRAARAYGAAIATLAKTAKQIPCCYAGYTETCPRSGQLFSCGKNPPQLRRLTMNGRSAGEYALDLHRQHQRGRDQRKP